MRQALRLVPLALLAFVLTAGLIRALLPLPADQSLAARLAAWQLVRDEIDVLFLGSSRVAHGVAPQVFDAELAARGLPLRSFNLGCDGMGSFETDALLRELLAERPARLRFVLIELDAWRPAPFDSGWLWTAREIGWHDLRLTLEALRSIRIGGGGWPEKLLTARAHIEHFLTRWTNRGLLRERVAEELAPLARSPGVEPPPTVEALLASQGFEAYPVTDADGRPAFRGDRAELARTVQGARDRPDIAEALSFFNVHAVNSQRAAVERAGLRAIYFVTPTTRWMPYVAAVERLGLLDPRLAFHKPQQHPDLFDGAVRYDTGDHLNADGAARFSRALAESFAALAGEPPASPER